MLTKTIAAVALLALLGVAQAGTLRAGIAKIDASLPVGIPLGGYSARKDKLYPIPKIGFRYTTWMQPSIGIWEPTWAKALVIDDGEGTRIAHMSLDIIGSDGGTVDLAWKLAHERGFTVPYEATMFHAAHTHSGPGVVSYEKLWEIAPATDKFIPSLQYRFAESIATSLLQAESELQPVRLGFSMHKMYNVTHNRRASESPYVEPWSIDPNTGIFRVDTLDGQPLATVWNFAIHGTCLSPANLKLSGDIMGVSNDEIETSIGGISMFINADAGDIAPDGSTVCGHDVDVTHSFPGRYIIAKHIADFREATETFTEGKVTYAQFDMDFGMTNLNLTSDRLAMLGVCSADARRHSMNLCEMCAMLNCDVEVAMDGTWVENTPRFTALHWEIGGEEKIMVTIPGEALEELGKEIRSDAKELGFDTDNTFLLGYSQNHMGYFTTPNEYLVGGYESLLSFWGIETGEKVRFGCRNAMKKVMGVALEEEK